MFRWVCKWVTTRPVAGQKYSVGFGAGYQILAEELALSFAEGDKVEALDALGAAAGAPG